MLNNLFEAKHLNTKNLFNLTLCLAFSNLSAQVIPFHASKFKRAI